MPNKINFYQNRLGNEDWLCSCDIDDLMSEPNIGDMVWLPFDVPEDEKDVWVVKQKYISTDEIACFCKRYNWEDSWED